jgi:hypothetical protein
MALLRSHSIAGVGDDGQPLTLASTYWLIDEISHSKLQNRIVVRLVGFRSAEVRQARAQAQKDYETKLAARLAAQTEREKLVPAEGATRDEKDERELRSVPLRMAEAAANAEEKLALMALNRIVPLPGGYVELPAVPTHLVPGMLDTTGAVSKAKLYAWIKTLDGFETAEDVV